MQTTFEDIIDGKNSKTVKLHMSVPVLYASLFTSLDILFGPLFGTPPGIEKGLFSGSIRKKRYSVLVGKTGQARPKNSEI